MFDGIIAQLRPVGAHCQSEFQRLMRRLEAIQVTIADGQADPFDRRQFARFSTSANVAPSDPLFTVPLGQVWVVEMMTMNGTVGSRAVLSQAVNMGLPIVSMMLDNAGSTGIRGRTDTPGAVILPQTPVYITVTDNATALDIFVQIRCIDIPTGPQPAGINPAKARSGSGKEGITTSDGPPVHELGRDASTFILSSQ